MESCVFVKWQRVRLCPGVCNHLKILFRIQTKVLLFDVIPMRLVMHSSEFVSFKEKTTVEHIRGEIRSIQCL